MGRNTHTARARGRNADGWDHDQRRQVRDRRSLTGSAIRSAYERQLFIAAGEVAASAEDLPFGVRNLIDAAEEILVITPTLPGRFVWLSSATDRAREQDRSNR
jgi:hypothetical protein